MLIRVTRQNLRLAYPHSLELLDLVKQIEVSEVVYSGYVVALIYLWNPFKYGCMCGLFNIAY